MKQETILILGAGIAGLVAARALAHDYHVILLEAAGRAGGRIHSYNHSSFSTVIEGGAEFLHGDTRHTQQLLKEAGIKYIPLHGKMYRKEDGRWHEQTEMAEGWDELIEKMGELDNDMTLQDFLETHYAGPEFEELRMHTINYAEGFDSAEASRASTKTLYKEWAHEGEQYRVDGGYGKLVDFLVRQCNDKGCELHLNTIAKQVRWQQNEVSITTAGGKEFTGNKCIITLPVSILQLPPQEKMALNISLPGAWAEAIKQPGFGGVVKVVLEFTAPLWKEDTGFIFCDEPFPTWWTQLPSPAPVLTLWAGGPRAQAMGNHSDEDLLHIAITSLAKVFDLSYEAVKEQLKASKVFNWLNAPTALGCYSYATLTTAAARKVMHIPIEETLYFAGEGWYEGPYPGTVEAAISNAMDMVAHIIPTKHT